MHRIDGVTFRNGSIDLCQDRIAYRYQAEVDLTPYARLTYVDSLRFVLERIGRINSEGQLINGVRTVLRLQRVIEDDGTCLMGRQRLQTPLALFVLASRSDLLDEIRNSVHSQLQRIDGVATVDILERVIQGVRTRSQETVFLLSPYERLIHIDGGVLSEEMTWQNGSREGNDGVTAVDILLRYRNLLLSSSRVPLAGELHRVPVAERSTILTVGGRYRRNDYLFLYRLCS